MLRLLFLCVLWLSSVSAATPRYYAVFFATGEDHRTLHTHTFATFVRWDGSMQWHTISWLPATYTGHHMICPGAQVGKNFSLSETFALAAVAKAPVYVWGPYIIDEKTYTGAVLQSRKLNRGLMSYNLLDGLSRFQSSLNCIHAVSDAFPGGPSFTGAFRGKLATGLVLHHLSRRHLLRTDEVELSVLHRLMPIARGGQTLPEVFVRQAETHRWLPYDAMPRFPARR